MSQTRSAAKIDTLIAQMRNPNGDLSVDLSDLNPSEISSAQMGSLLTQCAVCSRVISLKIGTLFDIPEFYEQFIEVMQKREGFLPMKHLQFDASSLSGDQLEEVLRAIQGNKIEVLEIQNGNPTLGAMWALQERINPYADLQLLVLSEPTIADGYDLLMFIGETIKMNVANTKFKLICDDALFARLKLAVEDPSNHPIIRAQVDTYLPGGAPGLLAAFTRTIAQTQQQSEHDTHRESASGSSTTLSRGSRASVGSETTFKFIQIPPATTENRATLKSLLKQGIDQFRHLRSDAQGDDSLVRCLFQLASIVNAYSLSKTENRGASITGDVKRFFTKGGLSAQGAKLFAEFDEKFLGEFIQNFQKKVFPLQDPGAVLIEMYLELKKHASIIQADEDHSSNTTSKAIMAVCKKLEELRPSFEDAFLVQQSALEENPSRTQ